MGVEQRHDHRLGAAKTGAEYEREHHQDGDGVYQWEEQESRTCDHRCDDQHLPFGQTVSNERQKQPYGEDRHAERTQEQADL